MKKPLKIIAIMTASVIALTACGNSPELDEKAAKLAELQAELDELKAESDGNKNSNANNARKEVVTEDEASDASESESSSGKQSKPCEVHPFFADKEFTDEQKENIIMGIPWTAQYDDVYGIWETEGLKASWYEHDKYQPQAEHEREILSSGPSSRYEKLFPEGVNINIETNYYNDRLERFTIDADDGDIEDGYAVMEYVKDKIVTACGEATTGTAPVEYSPHDAYHSHGYFWYIDGDLYSPTRDKPWISLEKYDNSENIYLKAGCGNIISEYIHNTPPEKITLDLDYDSLPDWVANHKSFIEDTAARHIKDPAPEEVIRSLLIDDKMLESMAWEWAYGIYGGEIEATDIHIAQVVEPHGYVGEGVFEDGSRVPFAFNKATGAWIEKNGSCSEFDIRELKDEEHYVLDN